MSAPRSLVFQLSWKTFDLIKWNAPGWFPAGGKRQRGSQEVMGYVCGLKELGLMSRPLVIESGSIPNCRADSVHASESSSLLPLLSTRPQRVVEVLCRFEAEKLLINNHDSGVTSAAMARGVCAGSSLRFLHNKRSLEDMIDLLNKVEKYLGAEEDSEFHQEEAYTGRKRSVRLESRALGGHIQGLSRPLALRASTFTTKSKAKTSSSDSISVLRGEIKSQRKQVRNLKKKSLWSRSMEEVMGKLVDIVLFLNWEIHNGFGIGESSTPSNGSLNIRLGPAGLALHYANIVLQIDSIVARSNAMPPNTRDTLYQSLPPSIKSPLRAKLHSFHVKEELTVTEIKAEMEKTLHWLVPISINTAKAHHGFGWVGEWANTGSEVNRKPTGLTDIIRIDTLHHADKQKTEAYILELMAWLNHLVSRSKVVDNGGSIRSPITVPTHQENNHLLTNETANASSPLPKVEDQEIIYKERTQETIRKIQDFESVKSGVRKHDEQMESNGDSPTRGSNNFLPAEGHSSSIPVVGVDIKAMDVLCIVDNPI
ncbi:hypothetical protein RJ639_009702 [Escallonia herrerae]|uniref:DUF668 domain-containing protein n=1 Tax=Escallonia herrerae TaxID=1293975 RepID=A0AA88VPW0_9ASTE|nr:hypothetical protein RJ639_009702 [Escallonia herrerae]